VEAAAAPRAIARAAGPPPCRRYTAATTLQGDAGPVRGIACPGPNGTWHIITERASLD
jgi:surface antigen